MRRVIEKKKRFPLDKIEQSRTQLELSAAVTRGHVPILIMKYGLLAFVFHVYPFSYHRSSIFTQSLHNLHVGLCCFYYFCFALFIAPFLCRSSKIKMLCAPLVKYPSA